MNLQGLLADPGLNLGIGLLAASGPSPMPVSAGQAIAGGMGFASDRERASLENRAAREALMSRQRQRQAIQRLPGLLAGGDPQQEALYGLLADASPETLVSMIAPQQERAMPPEVRIAQFLTDPTVPEATKVEVRKQIESQGNDQMLAQLDLAVARFNFENAQRAAAREAETERVAAATRQTSSRSALAHLKEAAELNDFLSDSFLRTGATWPDAKRVLSQGLSEIKEFFGADDSEARQIQAAFDRLKKLSSELIIEDVGRLSGSGLGQATNQRLTLLGSAMAGTGVAPEANAKIFGEGINDLLDVADIEGIDVGDTSEYRDLSGRLLSTDLYDRTPFGALPDLGESVGRAASALSARADAIRQYTAEQIRGLSAEDIREWTQEQRDALEARIDELSR